MSKNLQHLDFISNEVLEFMKQYNGKQVSLVPLAYFELVTRLRSATIGLRKLVEEIDKTPELEFSAALTIRTMIVDFFIGLRGYDLNEQLKSAGKSKEEIDIELKNYFGGIMADGVNKAGKLFVRMESKGHLTEAQLHSVLKTLSEKYSSFLNPYANNKQAPGTKFPNGQGNAADLFDKISDSPIGDTKTLAQYYETYGLYSKYEHFSAISSETIRRDVPAQANTLESGIQVLLLHFYICVRMISEYLNDEYTTQMVSRIGKYIEKEVHNVNHDKLAKEI